MVRCEDVRGHTGTWETINIMLASHILESESVASCNYMLTIEVKVFLQLIIHW
jgi:hypothetical protein